MTNAPRIDAIESDVSSLLAGGGGGSGTGGINFLKNGDAESSTISAADVEATGGPAVARTTTLGEIILGDASFKVTGAASGQVDWKLNTISDHFNGQLFNVTARIRRLAGSGDMIVTVHDGTADVAGTSHTVTTTADGDFLYNVLYVHDTTKTYTLRITTAGSAADFLSIDDIRLGPQNSVSGGVPTQEWTEFTPDWDGGTLVVQNNQGWWRRVGDTMEIRASFEYSSGGDANSIKLTIPNSLTADTTKYRALVKWGDIFGSATWFNDSTEPVDLTPVLASTTTFTFTKNREAADSIDGDELATDDEITCILSIPIAEWAGETVSMANSRVEYVYNSATWADSSDTTSFATGMNGVAFASTDLTTTRTRRVQFSREFRHVWLEVQIAGRWLPMIGALPDVSGNDYAFRQLGYRITAAATDSLGVGLQPVSGSTTQWDVLFGKRFSSYNGDNSASEWSTEVDTSIRWRVVGSDNPLGIGTGLATTTTPGAILKRPVAKYRTDVADSITGSATIIDFEDQEIDNTSAVTTGASWKFTAATSGYYRCAAQMLIIQSTATAWNVGEQCVLYLYKNGSIVSRTVWEPHSNGVDPTFSIAIDDVLDLSSGDYVDFRISQGSGGTVNIFNDSQFNFCTVHMLEES